VRKPVISERPDAQLTYTIKSAAEVLDVSQRWLWVLIKTGKLSSYKVKGRVLIPRADLLRLLNANKRAAGEKASNE
jgi:excisionase family DNA binding protein